jgi:hypothetical protein
MFIYGHNFYFCVRVLVFFEIFRSNLYYYYSFFYYCIKIVHSSFDVVLQTIKHTMIYPASDHFLEIIDIHSAA